MQDRYTSKVFDIDYTSSRKKMRDARVMSEAEALDQLKLSETTDAYQRADFQKKTSNLIKDLRASNQPDLLSLFISEYNLTSDEGLSLMTLVGLFLESQIIKQGINYLLIKLLERVGPGILVAVNHLWLTLQLLLLVLQIG